VRTLAQRPSDGLQCGNLHRVSGNLVIDVGLFDRLQSASYLEWQPNTANPSSTYQRVAASDYMSSCLGNLCWCHQVLDLGTVKRSGESFAIHLVGKAVILVPKTSNALENQLVARERASLVEATHCNPIYP